MLSPIQLISASNDGKPVRIAGRLQVDYDQPAGRDLCWTRRLKLCVFLRDHHT